MTASQALLNTKLSKSGKNLLLEEFKKAKSFANLAKTLATNSNHKIRIEDITLEIDNKIKANKLSDS